MLDTKTNTNTLLKVNKNIIEHNDCILQMDGLYEKLKEKDKYIYDLEAKHIELENKFNKLDDVNCNNVLYMIKLQNKIVELEKWKNTHVCRCDCKLIDIEFKKMNEEITNLKNNNFEDPNNLKQFNEEKIKPISILDDLLYLKLKKTNENIHIEDNNLFKQIKDQNDLLLKTKNILINEELENQRLQYDKRFIGLEEKINKSNNKKIVNKPIKYSTEDLFNSIIIYSDLDSEWKIYHAARTLNKILDINNFDIKINKDNNVNKDNYLEVNDWISKSDKIEYKSNYFKLKHERCIYI